MVVTVYYFVSPNNICLVSVLPFINIFDLEIALLYILPVLYRI